MCNITSLTLKCYFKQVHKTNAMNAEVRGHICQQACFITRQTPCFSIGLGSGCPNSTDTVSRLIRFKSPTYAMRSWCWCRYKHTTKERSSRMCPKTNSYKDAFLLSPLLVSYNIFHRYSKNLISRFLSIVFWNRFCHKAVKNTHWYFQLYSNCLEILLGDDKGNSIMQTDM
jgi:hypothetical protein